MGGGNAEILPYITLLALEHVEIGVRFCVGLETICPRVMSGLCRG